MANEEAPEKRTHLEDVVQEECALTIADIDTMIEAARLPTDDPELTARVASRHSELARRVELALATFAHDRIWEAPPAPSKVAKELDKIALAGRRLLAAMNVTEKPGGVFVVDDTNSPVRLTDAARHVLQAQLAALAEQYQGYPGAFPDLCPSEWRAPDKEDGTIYIDYHPGQALNRAAAAVHLLTHAAQIAHAALSAEIEAGVEAETSSGRGTRNRGKVALRRLIHRLGDIYISIFERTSGSAVSTIDGRVDGPEIRFIQAVLRPSHIVTSNGAIRDHLRRRRARDKLSSKKT